MRVLCYCCNSWDFDISILTKLWKFERFGCLVIFHKIVTIFLRLLFLFFEIAGILISLLNYRIIFQIIVSSRYIFYGVLHSVSSVA